MYRGEGETVAEVARFLDTDAAAAAVSRPVDRLAEKGLVARSADPASRRRVLLALTPLGPVVPQGTPLVTGSLDVPPFDRDALIGALRAGQAGMTTCTELPGAAWRAGVPRYVAGFDAREVTYYGWNGESCLGSCPDTAIEQSSPRAPRSCNLISARRAN